MKCGCLDSATSYERLPSASSLSLSLATLRNEDKDASNEKEEELTFYNDDGSSQSVVVERDLCAADLCQLLALKNRVAKDVNWAIVEHWPHFGLERSLEDHELVLSVHHDTEAFGRRAHKRYVFRKDFRKYEFFHDPQQFFPADMVDLNSCEELSGNAPFLDQTAVLQSLVSSTGECPPIFSQVWVRDANKNVWNKAFLLLKNKCLYLSYKIQVVAKFLRNKETSSKDNKVNSESQLHLFADLQDYQVYWALNARNQLRAPTEFGLCLRPSQPGVELRSLACESDRARLCWLTAMRLAKYGKQLRENYRAFKNKQVESISPKEYNSYTVPNESVRSRVAMDFTGSVGRIVEDEREARAIAVSEGTQWHRRFRPPPRRQPPPRLDAALHLAQPWFHAAMTRDAAAHLVASHGNVDGVFLVRESRSSPGSFVLTFKCGGKVLHTQIQPVIDQVREALCYSLDSGVTKFYDLLQLVEFYQLNAGCLPTRLTHYVMHSPCALPRSP